MSFLTELRKRKVFQVAIGYLAVAWLLVEVTATILPAFDLPVWALRFVILLFVLGFPIALLMAWALELTPEGVKLDVSTAGGKRMLAIAVVFMAVALGWFFRGYMFPTQHLAQPASAGAASTQPKADERSIAVLPLVNGSNDPDQQFFSDGLSENLIDSLSRFDGLKVIGRISAFQFRDSKDGSATIGSKLGVAYLLNGSVQRDGDVVRISASLTEAADGSTLWAEHYDRPYKNLFALQDEIAQAVAGAMQVKLLSPAAAKKQDDRPPSGNIEAYNAYLHGLQFEREWGKGKAIEYFAKAVQIDPGYAAAWAHLSGTWTGIARYGDIGPAAARESIRKARSAVDKALQLAPELGIAHVDQAWVSVVDSDYRGALTECRRGLQLAPESGPILYGCSWILAMYGQVREAIQVRERLLSVEPLVAEHYQEYAKLLVAMGRLGEAEKQFGTALELEGKTQPQPDYLLKFAVLRGDAKAALEAARQMDSGGRDLALATAMQIDPDRAVADVALTKFLRDNPDWGDSRPYDLASLYALRGDADRTVAWLDRAWNGNHIVPTERVLYDPLILRFREDPKFIAFCKKIGLPPPSESESLSIDQIRALPSTRQARKSGVAKNERKPRSQTKFRNPGETRV